VLDQPNRDRIAERRASTRAEILDAAWDVCRAEGLAALSMREVGRRVGLRAPSLYSYFDSKNAIYDAMFAQGCAEFVARQPRFPTDVRAGVRAVLRYYVDFCTADPVRHQLLFQRTVPGFVPSSASFEISSTSLQAIADWMSASGLGGPDALDLYTAIGSGLAAQQNANEPGGDRWTRLVDQAADMFVDYVSAPQRPPAAPPGKEQA
jgi:AcrR family transcriptional regulator